MNSLRGSSFFAFIIGLALGGLLGVVFAQKYLTASSSSGAPIVETKRDGVTTTQRVENTEETISRKLREWKLTPEDLKQDLAKAGETIRRESGNVGTRVAEATSDVRIIAVIKAKYTVDDRLSAWNISVGCKDGHVTLGGTVSSADLLGRAIAVALDTNGVVDVVSSLRVQP